MEKLRLHACHLQNRFDSNFPASPQKRHPRQSARAQTMYRRTIFHCSMESEKSVNPRELCCTPSDSDCCHIVWLAREHNCIWLSAARLSISATAVRASIQLHFRKSFTLLCSTSRARVRRAIFLQFSLLQHSKLLQNNKWDFKKTCFSVTQSAIQRNNTYCTLHNCNLYRH